MGFPYHQGDYLSESWITKVAQFLKIDLAGQSHPSCIDYMIKSMHDWIIIFLISETFSSL